MQKYRTKYFKANKRQKTRHGGITRNYTGSHIGSKGIMKSHIRNCRSKCWAQTTAESMGLKTGRTALKQPTYDLIAKDECVELKNCEMKVTDIYG